MYTPKLFENQDTAQLLALMRAHPFATVITIVEGAPFVSHLPLLVDESPEGILVLTGHLARANPHWRHLKEAETLFIFHGPHTYVTPSWYKDPENVPTWNYAVVHAYGAPKLIEDAAGLRSLLTRLVDENERHEPNPWKFDLAEDFTADLLRGIVGFEVRVTRIEAKFKLSQNRAPEDRAGVIEGLKTRGDEMSRQVLRLME